MDKYIDKTIIIEKSNLPKILLEYIKKLEDYAKKDDATMYLITFENFDSTIKGFVIDNKLTEKQYINLIRKYGGIY